MRISDWSSDVCSSDLHTCSVTCKQVWTTREGVEYAWFNNVESKPGIGYPKDWENQNRWNGGWRRKGNDRIQPRMGGKWRILANIFANPDLPEIDDYYEPFDFEYRSDEHTSELQSLMRSSYAVFRLQTKQVITPLPNPQIIHLLLLQI